MLRKTKKCHSIVEFFESEPKDKIFQEDIWGIKFNLKMGYNLGTNSIKIRNFKKGPGKNFGLRKDRLEGNFNNIFLIGPI